MLKHNHCIILFLILFPVEIKKEESDVLVKQETEYKEFDIQVPVISFTPTTKVHLTSFEISGLSAIIKFLTQLPLSKRSVPELLMYPEKLLFDARKLVEEHKDDDLNHSITNQPSLFWITKKMLVQLNNQSQAKKQTNKIQTSTDTKPAFCSHSKLLPSSQYKVSLGTTLNSDLMPSSIQSLIEQTSVKNGFNMNRPLLNQPPKLNLAPETSQFQSASNTAAKPNMTIPSSKTSEMSVTQQQPASYPVNTSYANCNRVYRHPSNVVSKEHNYNMHPSAYQNPYQHHNYAYHPYQKPPEFVQVSSSSNSTSTYSMQPNMQNYKNSSSVTQAVTSTCPTTSALKPNHVMSHMNSQVPNSYGSINSAVRSEQSAAYLNSQISSSFSMARPNQAVYMAPQVSSSVGSSVRYPVHLIQNPSLQSPCSFSASNNVAPSSSQSYISAPNYEQKLLQFQQQTQVSMNSNGYYAPKVNNQQLVSQQPYYNVTSTMMQSHQNGVNSNPVVAKPPDPSPPNPVQMSTSINNPGVTNTIQYSKNVNHQAQLVYYKPQTSISQHYAMIPNTQQHQHQHQPILIKQAQYMPNQFQGQLNSPTTQYTPQLIVNNGNNYVQPQTNYYSNSQALVHNPVISVQVSTMSSSPISHYSHPQYTSYINNQQSPQQYPSQVNYCHQPQYSHSNTVSVVPVVNISSVPQHYSPYPTTYIRQDGR